jgi:hypothetical protein
MRTVGLRCHWMKSGGKHALLRKRRTLYYGLLHEYVAALLSNSGLAPSKVGVYSSEI